MKASTSKRTKARAKPRIPKKGAYNKTYQDATRLNSKGAANFAKGNPGKPRGRLTAMKFRVKEAVLEAAERSGRDGKGRDGMVGYLVWLSRTEPGVFGRMLEKIMPTQVELSDRTTMLTPSEAAERLRLRGIPVPPLLMELTAEDVLKPMPELRVVSNDAPPLGDQSIVDVEPEAEAEYDEPDDFDREDDDDKDE